MSVHLCHPTTSPYENYREGTQSATRLRNAHNVRFGSLADMRSAKRSCPRSAKSGHWEKACRLFAGAYDRVRRPTRALARFIPGAVFAIPLSRSEALGGIAQAVLQSLPRIGFNHRTDQLQSLEVRRVKQHPELDQPGRYRRADRGMSSPPKLE